MVADERSSLRRSSLLGGCARAPCRASRPLSPDTGRARAAAAEKVTPAQVKAAIDLLGSFDFPIRMDAARTVRRADAAIAVPALLEAVASHADCVRPLPGAGRAVGLQRSAHRAT